MSKICMVTDSHFSVHKASDVFLNSQMAYFKDQLFPYLKKEGITEIYHLGDLFDNRQSLNVRIMNAVHDMISGEGSEFQWNILVGNHDSTYKTTIETHSLKSLKGLPNVNIIDDIELREVHGKKVLMVPWQVDNDEFKKRVAKKNLSVDVCMGHFETKGFQFNKGRVCETGIDSDLFYENYTLTFSGHFHKRSERKRNNSKIVYIGNCYHLTRHDIGEERGCCILDMDTLEYEFEDNTTSLRYVKKVYPERILKREIKGNIIDVHVDISDDKYDEKEFQKYINKIEGFDPIVSPIVKIENHFVPTTETDFQFNSVPELMKEYIDKLDPKNLDSEILFNKMITLYNECKTEL